MKWCLKSLLRTSITGSLNNVREANYDTESLSVHGCLSIPNWWLFIVLILFVIINFIICYSLLLLFFITTYFQSEIIIGFIQSLRISPRVKTCVTWRQKTG